MSIISYVNDHKDNELPKAEYITLFFYETRFESWMGWGWVGYAFLVRKLQA